MYQIIKFKSKGLFGGKSPVDVANDWLILMGNTIKVVNTSPIFDDDGKLLELLLTYETDEIIQPKPKSVLPWKGLLKNTTDGKYPVESKDTGTKEVVVEREEIKVETAVNEIIEETKDVIDRIDKNSDDYNNTDE